MDAHSPAPQSLHTWMGWIGMIIALSDYALFAAGAIHQLIFFGAGAIASVFLTYALYKDKAHYGSVLQAIFILLNLIGMIRILL